MLGLVIAFVVGVAVTSGVFIVFGKNNKRKIAAAREAILEVYEAGKDKFDKKTTKKIKKL